jgi:hypothetical protein
MKTRTNIRTLQAMFLALFMITLTACGSGGDSSAAADPAIVALTATAIQLAQEAFDVITAVLNSSIALLGTQLETLQTAFDGFINTLSSNTALTGADIQSVQNVLDDYIGTTDASAGALTAAQIQLAQEALDAARPILP